MIERAARHLAIKIKNTNPEETATVETMEESLIYKLNNASIIVLSLAIGWALGNFIETLVAMLGFAVLRRYSGGFHFSRPELCVLVSTLIFTGIPMVPLGPNEVLYINIFTWGVMLILSPRFIDGSKPIASASIYKVVSLFLVTSNFFIQSPALALAFMAQGILIILVRR